MELLSISIQNLKSYNNSQIIISHITSDDLEKIKASNEDCSGIINKLSTISGCKFVCFIYPMQNQLYVSMRAQKGFDVSIIAKENGGGGHKGAAAYLTSKTFEEIKEDIVSNFTKQLKHIKENYKSLF